MSKPYLITAAALCLTLLPMAQGFAGAPDAPTQAAAQPATPPPAAAGDAAAKHAKRTACLKDAKEKKLVGAAKAAFVKNCAAAP